MHVVQHPRRQRVHRRIYLPSERRAINGTGLGSGTRYVTGLGELDGLFNIGKMFSRLTTFTPGSFKIKNIMGALGSATAFTLTGGLSTLAPKVTGAHSSAMKALGYGTAAVAAVAGGVALLPAGTLASVGSAVGTGLKTVASIAPVAGKVLGGSGGQQQVQQQQSGMTQAEYDAYILQQQQQAQAQAAYEAQVRAQQQQLYQPGAAQGIPISYDMGQPSMTGMNASYGDLRSPYTAITQDGEQVQIDPATGQVIQPGISTEMMIGIGGVVLLAGWYFMSGSKSDSNN